MSEATSIEWADSTFNPWEGCQKVGPGCDHCYAENRNARFGGGTAPNWGPGAPRRRTSADNWDKPARWELAHEAFFAQHGRRRRVFCASLADVFDNEVDPQWRADLFALILSTPNLDWLLLTKRIGNAHRMMSDATARVNLEAVERWPIPNVWLGATVVNQAEADRDIPKLLAVPARVRFLSIEPMLGPIDLQHSCTLRCPNGDCEFDTSAGRRLVRDSENGGAWIECICSRLNGLDWVIAGGESGPNARPMSIQWARELRDQCAVAGVPFLFKQWGEWAPSRVYRTAAAGNFAFGDYKHDRSRFVLTKHYPRAFDAFGARCISERVGKKAAGRLLDGRTHDGFPEA